MFVEITLEDLLTDSDFGCHCDVVDWDVEDWDKEPQQSIPGLYTFEHVRGYE